MKDSEKVEDGEAKKASRQKKKKSKSKEAEKEPKATEDKSHKQAKNDDLAFWLSPSNGCEENNAVKSETIPEVISETKKSKKEKSKKKEKKERDVHEKHSKNSSSKKVETGDLLNVGSYENDQESVHRRPTILGNWQLVAEDKSLQTVR